MLLYDYHLKDSISNNITVDTCISSKLKNVVIS